MDNELRLIRYLYGEEDRPEEVERLLASDDALRAEYRRLHAVKTHLDGRPPQRPDADVLDAVMDAAAPTPPPARPDRAPAASPASPRADRKPAKARRTLWPRIARATAVLAVLLVGVSIGVWQWGGNATAPLDATAPAVSSTAEGDRGDGAAAAGDAAIPDWDEADDVVRLHRHLETLQARSSPTRWDYPGAELQMAGQVRPSSN